MSLLPLITDALFHGFSEVHINAMERFWGYAKEKG
jgi:hypothetical protein